jgi:CheY-like chemotaxis protein
MKFIYKNWLLFNEKKIQKVLIVDDAKIARQTLKNILKKSGIDDIEEATNGQEALDLLENNERKIEVDLSRKIDLIFCDWNMPIMSGIELLQLLKKSYKFKSIPFVMLTIESDKANIQQAIKNGVRWYLVKPINPKMIADFFKKI